MATSCATSAAPFQGRHSTPQGWVLPVHEQQMLHSCSPSSWKTKTKIPTRCWFTEPQTEAAFSPPPISLPSEMKIDKYQVEKQILRCCSNCRFPFSYWKAWKWRNDFLWIQQRYFQLYRAIRWWQNQANVFKCNSASAACIIFWTSTSKITTTK